MNLLESLALLNECEERFPVDCWQVGGVHVWPLIRLQIFFQLRDLKVGVTPNLHSFEAKGFFDQCGVLMSRLGLLKQCILAKFKDRSHNASVKRADAVFLSDNASRILLEGEWYDRLLEPIIERLNEKAITHFHMEPRHIYRIPRHNSSKYIQLGLDFKRIRNVIFSSEKLTCQTEGLDDFLEFLALKGLGIKLPSIRELSHSVRSILAYADYYNQILKKVQPSIAFVVEYYGSGMPYTLACNQLGIPVVEIPHGVHGETHCAYSRWRKVPAEGYELLPSIFWCWSETEAGVIREWSDNVEPTHRVFVGGNLWLSRWLGNSDERVKRYDQVVASIKDNFSSEVHILLTYQFNIEEMISMMKTAPLSWCWWVRVHPCKLQMLEELDKKIKKAGINNYEIEQASTLPLYSLLRNMDLHVTECSSVVIEAEQFGVGSIITTDYGAQVCAEQILKGSAVVTSGIYETIAEIERQAKSSNCKQGWEEPEPLPDLAVDRLLVFTDRSHILTRVGGGKEC